MNIFLIGLPGSGKSTLGKNLSNKLSYPYLDTDEEIVKQEGTSIDDIFNTQGEEAFRKIERDVLGRVALLPNHVISTGGGSPCFFNNMDTLNNNGFTVYLDVPAEVICNRLFSQVHQERPMVKGKSKDELMEFLQTKLKEREPFYRRAHLTINHTTTAAMLVEMLKERKVI